MNKDDKKMMEDAYLRLIDRSGMRQGDEPYLLFGMLAMENEMLLQKLTLMENTHRAFVDHVNRRFGPKLVIPETGMKIDR